MLEKRTPLQINQEVEKIMELLTVWENRRNPN